MTSQNRGKLEKWNFCRGEVNDDANKNNDDYYKIINNKTTASKSFKYKTKITRITPGNNNRLNTKVFVPLKYLNNFWRSLDLSLIKCHVEFNLSW